VTLEDKKNLDEALDNIRTTIDTAAPTAEQQIAIEINGEAHGSIEEQSRRLEKKHSKLKPDALIVAALMGKTAAIPNNNNTNNAPATNFKRLKSQMSSPAQLTVSPVFVGDTPSQMSFVENQGGRTPNFEMTSLRTMDSQGAQAMRTHSQASPNNNNNNNTNNALSSSNNNNKSNIKTRANASRASKYLSVPLDENGVSDDSSLTKKQIVKKKWNQIKKTVNLPLRRSGRRKSIDSNFNSEYFATDEDEYGTDNECWEENAELPVISNEGYYWNGKDYSNCYVEDFKEIADFSADQFDRTEVPRMPWRDEAMVVFGDSARDLARHFIQRWNQCKREKARQIESFPFLLPKGYTEPYNYNYDDWFTDQLYKCNVQFTRSLDSWSGGISQLETSIQKAYCEFIRNAESYIYIENQFFVTTTDPDKDMDVKNRIGYELAERIKKAHRNKQKFRVYVVLPLLPGFDSFNAIQAVQFYNLRSIINGEYSIYKELTRAGIKDPTEYITFHGLRNWSVLMGKLVQGIIYVHSKLMIVDDKYVICGSANINDRSLLGSRDSEVAAVVKDEEFVNSTLNGVKTQVGKYAYSLRQKIFKLHLGIYFNNPHRIDISDCVCDQNYNLFRDISKANTKVYDDVFKCLPSDNVMTFEHLKTYTDKPCLNSENMKLGKEKLEGVQGFIVDFPLLFLSKEKRFFPEINTKEGMVPIIMWT